MKQEIFPKGHQKVNREYVSETRFLFHCHIKIKIPRSQDAARVLAHCFAILNDIERKYNSYSEGSYFHKLNTNPGKWTPVDRTTIALLETTNKAAMLTQGSYDITVMPLLQAWGFYNSSRNLVTPDHKKIQNAMLGVGYQDIKVCKNKVYIGPQQELITGSFIKAYAVGQVKEFLKLIGINDAIINAGGSTIVAINNSEHPYWNIIIPHPTAPGSDLMPIQLGNACLSLSGCASTFVEIDGERYGHIINARTGRPSKNRQAAVVSKSALESDILATALFVIDNGTETEIARALAAEFNFSYYIIKADWDGMTPQFMQT